MILWENVNLSQTAQRLTQQPAHTRQDSPTTSSAAHRKQNALPSEALATPTFTAEQESSRDTLSLQTLAGGINLQDCL